MELIRSFIAIELPEELKSALSELETKLKSRYYPSVKWADPDSIHLTLKFLGNIDAGRVGEIAGAVAASAEGCSPFRFEVKGLGVFPNPKRARVAWVGLSGDIDRLVQLQQRIEANLAPLGFTPESRPFAPHLTIARLRDQASADDRQSFGELLAGTGFDTAYSFKVNSVHLMRSQLTREGPIYSRLSSARLKET